jgi:hypothetical protein
MESEERFWSRVDVGEPDECWLWQGLKHEGYGRFYFKGRRVYVHRLSWEWANQQEIPKGMLVLHTCDQSSCVNPAHLQLGTQAENMRQMKERGRSRAGERNALAKMTDAQVKEIRRIANEGKLKHKEIAALVGVSVSGVRKVIYGTRWKHVN